MCISCPRIKCKLIKIKCNSKNYATNFSQIFAITVCMINRMLNWSVNASVVCVRSGKRANDLVSYIII